LKDTIAAQKLRVPKIYQAGMHPADERWVCACKKRSMSHSKTE
jgi:hypothetical protein